MEEFQINKNKRETIDKKNFEPIILEQNEIKYELNIETKEEMIIFSMIDKNHFPFINYNKTMNFSEIKDLNKKFQEFNSFDDFYAYLKLLSNNKKLNVKKCNNRLSIILNIEILLRQETIQIDLFSQKQDINLIIKEIWKEVLINKENIKKISELKNEIETLKNDKIRFKTELDNLNRQNEILKKENENCKSRDKEKLKEIEVFGVENAELKEKIREQNIEINNIKVEIKLLKEKIRILNYERSVIIKDDERSIIFQEIENKVNKPIIQLKKIYQATKDGGEPIMFHNKCDDIPNTLVLIKSEGSRRFGGFSPIPWKSDLGGSFKKDPEMKTFVFSLDNKKIYYLKDGNKYAVYHDKFCGPCFGGGHDIGICGNPIKEKKLFTNPLSFEYQGNIHALSEYENYQNIKAIEYEVFHIIFE